MHEHDLSWYSGRSYLDKDCFIFHGKETCYLNNGTHASYACCIFNNITILEWDNYMNKEFTKSDLKDGMVVELRNGIKYIKIGEKLLRNKNSISFRNYTKDMQNLLLEKLDIVCIYKIDSLKTCFISDIFNKENLIPIWRKEEKVIEVTMEELEKRYGCKVKIINKGE